MSNLKKKINEYQVDSKSIAIVTATYYPEWHKGEYRKDGNVDKIRGDLALKMLGEVQNKGFQTVVVDEGNNADFKTAISNFNIHQFCEKGKGMSERKQIGFAKASALKDVKVICWTEPEKAPFVKDCVLEAVAPVLKDEADVVVVERNEKLFKETYPDYQVDIEEESIRLWNSLLRRYGLRKKSDPDLDAWFGPRAFKNDPEIVSLFTDKYLFEPGQDKKLNEVVMPELWSNALYFPIIAALHKGLRVTGVKVPYKHPEDQTAVEQNNDVFRKKRKFQQENIILSSEYFIHYLLSLSSDNGRIRKES